MSSQALDRQELSLPRPEAAAVEVPGGSEFNQAREETDPVLPEADARPEAETGNLADVPQDAVDAPPAFDTTALEVPTPSVGEAGGLSDAPETSEAPDAPGTDDGDRPSDTATDLAVPDSPGAAPDAGGAGDQPQAPQAEDTGAAQTGDGGDAALSPTDLAVLEATDADTDPTGETGNAPAVSTSDEAPEAPEAPVVADAPAIAPAGDGGDDTPRLPQIATPTQPETTGSAPRIAATPTQPQVPVTGDSGEAEAPADEETGESLLRKVDTLENQAEEVTTDRLPRIGENAGDASDAGEDDGSVEEAAPDEGESGGLPTIRRLGNEGEPATDADDDTEVAATEEDTEDNAAPTGPAIVTHGMDFTNTDGTPLLSLVLVQDGGTALEPSAIEALPQAIAFAVHAGDAGGEAAAATYRSLGREVVMIPSLPEGARPQDVEQALRVNFDAIPQAVAIMDVSGSSFQSDRFAVEQIVDVILDSGHGLITYPRGLNTAHQSAERAGVPAGLIFRRLDGGNETVEQIRRTLDRAAFRARNDEAVILVGTTAPDTLAAILEWAAGNRSQSITIAPISAALLNE